MLHNLVGKYINGNYQVNVYEDGTKIRIQKDDKASFVPEFPENIDVTVTKKCDRECPFCYESCTKDGKHSNLKEVSDILLKDIHPYTELAINGNDLTIPGLEEFLETMKERKVFCNLTVNQEHFEKNYKRLLSLQDKHLICGLGISLNSFTKTFYKLIQYRNNIVIHTIAGVTSIADYKAMFGKNLKILILGFKTYGKGLEYSIKNQENIQHRISWLKENLNILFQKYEAVSFDTLATKQLKLSERIPEKVFDQIFLGEDGQFTFYLDAVNKTYAKNSYSTEVFPVENKSVLDMFYHIKQIL